MRSRFPSDHDKTKLDNGNDTKPKDSEETWKCWKRHPNEDWNETGSALALVMLFSGIIFVGVGYLIPRDHQIDPDMSARENELLGLSMYRRSQRLDICILVGITIVCIGAALMSAVFIHMIWVNGQRDVDELKVMIEANKTARNQGYGGTEKDKSDSKSK